MNLPKIRRHKDIVPFLIFVRPESLGLLAGLVHGSKVDHVNGRIRRRRIRVTAGIKISFDNLLQLTYRSVSL
jgi:hypothetical protein